MMNDPVSVIAYYLQRLDNVSHPIEEQIIKGDLFLYYYRLTDANCELVRPQMQPLLDEKRVEMEAHDPLLKRAGELLQRLQVKQTVMTSR